MFAYTETGSTYELHPDAPLVRRIGNSNDRQPTPSQGPDGEWREYRDLARFVYPDGARCLIFYWADGASETRTSPLVMGNTQVFHLLDRLPERGFGFETSAGSRR